MAEESAKVVYQPSEGTKPEEAKAAVESTDRGLFDFMNKDNKEEDKMASEFESKVLVSEAGEEEKHEGLVEKLHRSDSSSSSSSDEGEGHDEERKKKKKEKKEKKGLQEKMKEKLAGHEAGEEQKEHHHDEDDQETNVPVEQVHGEVKPQEAEEKKGFMDKIKEKKGFLDKIKEKIPGFHSKNATHEEKKDTN